MKYFKGISKSSDYPSTAYLKIDDNKQLIIESIVKREYDVFGVISESPMSHKIDVAYNQYISYPKSTLFDVWNIDRKEITEEEFEKVKELLNIW